MTVTRLLIALVAILSLGFAPAFAGEKPSPEEIARINALLAGMNCQMDDDDIEKEDDGFELDDVICADGQFDIELDANFEIVEKNAE